MKEILGTIPSWVILENELYFDIKDPAGLRMSPQCIFIFNIYTIGMNGMVIDFLFTCLKFNPVKGFILNAVLWQCIRVYYPICIMI